ncbi:trypsin-like serine peptidase [Staphylococcus durrellii]|uniref:trypsin-like serine peptidase n=1 Tax=Staphylococcus durrellii TaxID=2781773 RepID=UPI00189FBE10|nr:serine protease [Staphylococcus durrellii]MBF7016184.1 serine protease [Staphylococcus durrellii]
MSKKVLTSLVAILAVTSVINFSHHNIQAATNNQAQDTQPSDQISSRVILPNNDRHQVSDTKSAHYQSLGFVDMGQNIATGVVIGENTILTNKHVADLSNGNMKFAPAATDENTYPYGEFKEESSEQYDGDADLAVVHFKANDKGQHIGDVVNPATISDSTQEKKGDNITVTGYPGDKPTATMWESKGRILSNSATSMTYDASTYGGNSGSGVFNDENELIALHYGGVENESNNAVPLTGDVLKFVNENNS